LNLTINYPSAGTDQLTTCDNYLWIDGITYSSSNSTATHILTNSDGCDSIVTLDLTINYSSFGTDVITACNSYTWIDGNTYNSSNNTATDTLVNVVGCDSIVTLDLTIITNSTAIDVQNSCRAITWIDGNVYTSDNNTETYNIVGGSVNGCDSIVSLGFTFTGATSTDTRVECNPFVWIDGNTYTSNNSTAIFNIVGATCDSNVTLNLTILNSSLSIDLVTACDSYTWIDGNTYTSNNTTATHTLINVAGCDSVVTLDLTITNSTSGTDIQSVCDSYLWIDGNTYSSSISSVTHTLINAAGCDSIVTLDLTINTVETGITTDGLTMNSNATNSAYQWIDCSNNNEIIEGETSQSYTATSNGDYAVIITNNDCTDTSQCVTISTVEIEDNNDIIDLQIFPNPSSDGIFTIEFEGTLQKVEIQDLLGRKVSIRVNLDSKTVNDSALAPGKYFVHMTTVNGMNLMRELIITQ